MVSKRIEVKNMHIYVDIIIILPLLVLCYQLYSFSVNSKGRDMQGRCQKLGIAFMTLGIIVLVIRSVSSAFFGLIMIMLGFRLLAKGLDRLNKTKYIDRYDDDKQV